MSDEEDGILSDSGGGEIAHQKRVHIVHTSMVSLDELTRLFAELAPQVRVHHIVDDSLLAEVLEHGGVTPAVRKRMRNYIHAARDAGADMVFNQCSSVGEAADEAAADLDIPVVKIDSRMAEFACEQGRRIGVVATLPTTLGPTCRLIERTAEAKGRHDYEITPRLVEGAFEALIDGDRPRHNAMIIAAIEDLAKSVDVVVCAQGSMATIVEEMPSVGVPVLTSPRLGVENALQVLNGI